MIEDPGATSPQVIVFRLVCPVESLNTAMLPIAVTDPVELTVFEKVTAAKTQVAKSKKHKPTIAIAMKRALDLLIIDDDVGRETFAEAKAVFNLSLIHI